MKLIRALENLFFLPTPAKANAKNILLIKEPAEDAASFLVIRYFEEIMGIIKSSKAKDFAFLMSSATPKKIDLNWRAEVAARTFEASAYTFNATKNKTAKLVTVKKRYSFILWAHTCKIESS